MTLHVVRYRGNPTGICRLCRAKFYEGEEKAYERHVVACGSQNEDVLHKMSPRTRMPLLDPETGDKELEDWIREHKGAILQGRTTY